MTKFYWLRDPKEWRCTGDLSRARHKWGGLPGVHCSECGATWAGSVTAFPGVDLSSLPERREERSPARTPR
ncbi:MAG TPA: double-CXXCG motif protein [Archangium sp.]|jgi:hypothetical protein